MSAPVFTSLVIPVSSVFGTLVITSGFSYRMGKLVATVEAMAASAVKGQAAIETQVAAVAAAQDRHEQWHLDTYGRNGRRK